MGNNSPLEYVSEATYDSVLLTVETYLFSSLLHRCLDYYQQETGFRPGEKLFQVVMGMLDRDKPRGAVELAEEIGEFDIKSAIVIREAIRRRRSRLDVKNDKMLLVRTETVGVVRDCVTAACADAD